MIDFIAHLTRQAAASRGFFGPGARTKGVTDHIKKELVEVEKCYTDPLPTRRHEPPMRRLPADQERHAAAADEWTDVAILGMDGLLRSISAAHPDRPFHWVAQVAVGKIVAKQGKNELRDWPDWRTADPDEAIEHVRGKHD